tara:strand:- start:8 stop:625 length:618 start_codon:yes stop_codon:yes gene_type:complete
MALVKYNNNSISAITTARQMASGGMVLIKEQTASSSSSISFVDGSGGVVLDSTYPIYKFVFINCLPSSDGVKLLYNFSVDGGSNYNVTKTSTNFYAGHTEADATGFGYDSGLAQSTSGAFGTVGAIGSASDEGCSGEMFLFNPASTTFVKHFFGKVTIYGSNPQSQITYTGGYCNTTSAVDGVIVNFESGNIASGTIKLYGIKDS